MESGAAPDDEGLAEIIAREKKRMKDQAKDENREATEEGRFAHGPPQARRGRASERKRKPRPRSATARTAACLLQAPQQGLVFIMLADPEPHNLVPRDDTDSAVVEGDPN